MFSFLPFGVRHRTLPPPLSIAATSYCTLEALSSLEAWLQRGPGPPHSSLPGPQKSSTLTILFQGLPSGWSRETSRAHTAGLTHTGAINSKESSRGLQVTITGLQVLSSFHSVMIPLRLLSSTFFSGSWISLLVSCLEG